MTYERSSMVCDWCQKDFSDGSTVACDDCMTNCEAENSDLKDQVVNLKRRIDEVESMLEDALFEKAKNEDT